MKARVRFFVDGRRKEVFEVADLEQWLDQFKAFFELHPEILGEKHMVEIELLDILDINQRLFRFGNDPAQMVMPIRVNP